MLIKFRTNKLSKAQDEAESKEIVSDNFINILKYFGYTEVDKNTLVKFIYSDVISKISALIILDEVDQKPIDRKLLNNLAAVNNEFNDYLIDEIDFEDINRRLKEGTK